MNNPRPTVAVAIGFTALLATIVAAIWLADWKWLLIGVAAQLATAVWSATLERPQS